MRPSIKRQCRCVWVRVCVCVRGVRVCVCTCVCGPTNNLERRIRIRRNASHWRSSQKFLKALRVSKSLGSKNHLRRDSSAYFPCPPPKTGVAVSSEASCPRTGVTEGTRCTSQGPRVCRPNPRAWAWARAPVPCVREGRRRWARFAGVCVRECVLTRSRLRPEPSCRVGERG